MAESLAEPVRVDDLLAQARSQAELTDFGDDGFLVPLNRLVDAINGEARLIPAEHGPIERIVQALVDRLRKVDLLRQHPEILEQDVHVAGVILGLPRTGSTMLQRLLGATSVLTSGYWWEVTFPLPFPGEAPGDPSPRQHAAKAAVDAFLASWPDFLSIHPIDALAFDEEVILLDKTFLSSTYDSILYVPSYGRWMAEQDKVRSYQELREWLQILQWQSSWRVGRRWILKSPHHLLGGLEGVLTVFPRARVIMTHRPVAKTLPSYCSMCQSMIQGGAGGIAADDIDAYWRGRFERALRNLIAVRARLPAERFIDVAYPELIADPVAEAGRIIRALGVTFGDKDEAAMSAWLAVNGREDRPPHQYAPEDFGLSAAALAKDFAFYEQAFVAA
jgi:hypothetical protein